MKEILFAGCPTVGAWNGAEIVQHGEIGIVVDSLPPGRQCVESDADVRALAVFMQLLRVSEGDLEYLEKPLGLLIGDESSEELTSSSSPRLPVEVPRSSIGAFRLLEQIGEGGFGVVYMAQQIEPVRRRVALKVVKPGMSTKEVVQRFEAERQALAMMDHPNIARVFDGGATAAGQPYFVMELVRGIPITQYADQECLSTRQRLELFIDVCQAVQHAHQKGVIHRDLKPSNILVAEIDGRAVPKVIDFGVAKALSQELVDGSCFTRFDQIVGTPLYMSPEQAGTGVIDIDTRSDVYSLGVLLYELLTGRPPFDRDRLHQSGFDEFRRILREEEPKRPSFLVSTLKAEAMTTVCDRRSVSLNRLPRLLRGELDWIVMKALEKDRLRRYQSASDFAEDIQRYLDDKQVEARPPSIGYVLQKYSRRHRVALTTSALVALSILAGFGGTLWQLAEATQQRDRAIAAEQDARQKAQLAQQEAKRADEEARRANREAEISKAVSAFLNEDLLAQADPANQPNPNVKLREVIDRAAEQLENKFADQPLVEAKIRQTLAEAYDSLGLYDSAQAHVKRAVTLREQHLTVDDPAMLKSLVWAGWLMMREGRAMDSRRQLESVLPRVKASLGREHPLTFRASRYLASVLSDFGEYRESERILSESEELANLTFGAKHEISLASEAALADVYLQQGRLKEAEKLYRSVLEQRANTLGDDHPATLSSKYQLARILWRLRQHQQAQLILHEVIQVQSQVLGERHPATLSSMHGLAYNYFDIGLLTDAEHLAREILEVHTQVLGEDHPATLNSVKQLAEILLDKGEIKAAMKLHKELLATSSRSRGESHPDTLAAKRALGFAYLKQGQYAEAEQLLTHVLQGRKKLFGHGHPLTSNSLTDLANLRLKQGRHDEAASLFEAILESSRKQYGAGHPLTLDSMNNAAIGYFKMQRRREATSLMEQTLKGKREAFGENDPRTLVSIQNLAVFYGADGRQEESVKLAEEVLSRSREVLGEKHPETIKRMDNLGVSYTNVGRQGEAEKLLEQAFELRKETLGESHPDTLTSMWNAANSHLASKNYAEAEKILTNVAGKQAEVLGEKHPSTLNSLHNLMFTYRMTKRLDEARELCGKLIALYSEALGEDHLNTGLAIYNLGAICFEQQQYVDAEKHYRKAEQIASQTLGPLHPETLKFQVSVAKVLRTQGKYRESELLLKQCIEESRRIFGEASQQVIDEIDHLALTYREWNRIDDWERTVRENLEIKRRVLGEDHEETNDGIRQLRSVLMRRSESLVVGEEFEEAFKVLSEIVGLTPDRIQAEALVALQVHLGEKGAAVGLSQQLWERAQVEESGPSPASRWVLDALLSPNHGLDLTEITEFLESIPAGEDSHISRLALGLTHYRAGNFEQAVATIDTEDHGPTWIRPISSFVHAMASANSGDAESAKKSFDEAVTRMNKVAPTPTTGVELKSWEPPHWVLWCLYQGLKREASGVLEIETPKPLVESASEK